MKTIIALVIVMMISVNGYAGPSPAVIDLMNESVTIFDFSLLKLDLILSRIDFSSWSDYYKITKKSVSYDWEEDSIKIEIIAKELSERSVDKKLHIKEVCKHITDSIKKGIEEESMKVGCIGFGCQFKNADNKQFQTIIMELAKIINIMVTYYYDFDPTFSSSKIIQSSSLYHSDEITFLENQQ